MTDLFSHIRAAEAFVGEENDITDVEEIEFEFRAYDNNNWLGDDFANEIITLKP